MDARLTSPVRSTGGPYLAPFRAFPWSGLARCLQLGWLRQTTTRQPIGANIMQSTTTPTAVISLLIGIIAAAFAIFLFQNVVLGVFFALVFWVASYFLLARPTHDKAGEL